MLLRCSPESLVTSWIRMHSSGFEKNSRMRLGEGFLGLFVCWFFFLGGGGDKK